MSKCSLTHWLMLPFLVAAGCGGGHKSGTGADMSEGADLAIVSNTPDMSVVLDMTTPDDLAAPNQGPAPFIVDGTYAASGYYSDSGATLTDNPNCPTRGGAGRGACHHVTYKPAGATGYAGILWQYPANNWPSTDMQTPGFAIPAGYTQVQFYAWGAVGGEKLSFFAGDGVQPSVQGTPPTSELDLTLTATPTLYTLGISNLYGASTLSAFRWSLAAGTAATQFYVDDIVWAAPTTGVSPKAFGIDSNFAASGYMGDGANPGELVDQSDCTPTVVGATGCHHFVWNPTIDGGAPTNGWAGVYWQSPAGNWGGATDPTGAAITAGYTEVSFYAWTADGGETVSFFAGLGKDDFATKINAVMSTTPTLYTLGVGGAYGAHVVGGFGWSVGGAGVSLDITGVQWR